MSGLLATVFMILLHWIYCRIVEYIPIEGSRDKSHLQQRDSLLSSLKFAYELFSQTDARLLYPAIEHGRDRKDNEKYPAPEGTILHEGRPILSLNICKHA